MRILGRALLCLLASGSVAIALEVSAHVKATKPAPLYAALPPRINGILTHLEYQTKVMAQSRQGYHSTPSGKYARFLKVRVPRSNIVGYISSRKVKVRFDRRFHRSANASSAKWVGYHYSDSTVLPFAEYRTTGLVEGKKKNFNVLHVPESRKHTMWLLRERSASRYVVTDVVDTMPMQTLLSGDGCVIGEKPLVQYVIELQECYEQSAGNRVGIRGGWRINMQTGKLQGMRPSSIGDVMCEPYKCWE